jgi:hypothetical protein
MTRPIPRVGYGSASGHLWQPTRALVAHSREAVIR